jgi:hypothetical protein
MFIAFDDDSGTHDIGIIGSSFSIPPDYASGASLALRVSKDAHTATQTERITCFAFLNGGGTGLGESADITTADNTAYTLNLDFHPFAAGDAVNLLCKMQSEAWDDVVRIHSIEFRYEATQ